MAASADDTVPACEGVESLPDLEAAAFQQQIIQEYPDVFQSELTSFLKPIERDDIVHVIKLKDLQMKDHQKDSLQSLTASIIEHKRLSWDMFAEED